MIEYMTSCIEQYPDYEKHPEYLDGMTINDIWTAAQGAYMFRRGPK